MNCNSIRPYCKNKRTEATKKKKKKKGNNAQRAHAHLSDGRVSNRLRITICLIRITVTVRRMIGCKWRAKGPIQSQIEAIHRGTH